MRGKKMTCRCSVLFSAVVVCDSVSYQRVEVEVCGVEQDIRWSEHGYDKIVEEDYRKWCIAQDFAVECYCVLEVVISYRD